MTISCLVGLFSIILCLVFTIWPFAPVQCPHPHVCIFITVLHRSHRYRFTVPRYIVITNKRHNALKKKDTYVPRYHIIYGSMANENTDYFCCCNVSWRCVFTSCIEKLAPACPLDHRLTPTRPQTHSH